MCLKLCQTFGRNARDMCYNLILYLTVLVEYNTVNGVRVLSSLSACIHVWGSRKQNYCANEYQFQCANMVLGSKKRLGIGGVSNLLDGNEFAEKLIDSDSSEFSDAGESCVTDCGDQAFDAFLLVDGDNSGVGDFAYWSDTKFQWDMDSYIRHGENFTGISVPQDSAKGMTNITEIFENSLIRILFKKL